MLEGHGEAGVVMQAEAAIRQGARAGLRQMAPLGVGQRAEGRMDLAQMHLQRRDIGEAARQLDIGRDPLGGGGRHAAADVVQYQSADRMA